MSTIKIFATAAALLLGASAVTVAQAQVNGNPRTNAAASGGSGSHRDTPQTGSAATDAKIIHNQNGYAPQR
jgi:phage gp45-like